MLPKMGMNCHAPMAVVYGPKCLGGRQLMDLRVVQPTLYLEATIGYMRRGDKLGRTLVTTRRAV